MNEKEEITVEVDNSNDLRFHGELLSKAYTDDNTASGHRYSGEAGRWKELYLYKTVGGKYICHRIDKTVWDGEREVNQAITCESVDEVIEFFGYSHIAKELYCDANIDYYIKVE
ncbi:MAG: hypothetical protein ABW166_15070 [Sedimenticola sp.]